MSEVKLQLLHMTLNLSNTVKSKIENGTKSIGYLIMRRIWKRLWEFNKRIIYIFILSIYGLFIVTVIMIIVVVVVAIHFITTKMKTINSHRSKNIYQLLSNGKEEKKISS